MRRKTEQLLLEIGVPADSRGFHFVCDAIDMYESNESYIYGKHTDLYRAIAKKNNTSRQNAERCIRLATETVFACKDENMINTIIPSTQKRTVGNFLACLYMKLKND